MLLFGLTGCGEDEPVTGVVVEKDYDAASTKTERRCTGTGSSRKCRNVKKTKPADWDVTIRDDSGKEHEIDVSQSTYDRLKVGQRTTL